jgi:hypothetical protein
MVEEEVEEEEGRPSLVQADPCQQDAFLKSRQTHRIRHRHEFYPPFPSKKERLKLLR